MLFVVGKLAAQKLFGRQNSQIGDLLVGIGQRGFDLTFGLFLGFHAHIRRILLGAGAHILCNLLRIARCLGTNLLGFTPRLVQNLGLFHLCLLGSRAGALGVLHALIELSLPPLAERSDDIIPLAEYFLQGRASLDTGARSALLAHAWPGNVRELKNAIERASLLCSDATITARDLDLGPARIAGGRLPPEAEPDKGMIEAALQRARGVISQAASDLGLSRQALYRRMEKMGIET